MGFVIEGELINSYQDQTTKGKLYNVHQVSFKAGKQVTTITVKDYNGSMLPNGPVRLSVFPDVWIGKTGNAVVTWIMSKEQPYLNVSTAPPARSGKGLI